MNDTEKRELKAAIALKLGWQLIGGEWYSPEGERWINLPDWLGADWPALAEAMRQRGCWVKIILRPDSHKSAHKYYCEIEHRGEEWSYHANADTPGEAVALASKSALEAEVS